MYHKQVDEIKDTCAAALDRQKILLQKGFNDFKQARISHLNTMDTKIAKVTNVLTDNSKDIKQKQLEFASAIYEVATLKVDDMEQATLDIMSDVITVVSDHLSTDSMRTTLTTLAAEIFSEM